MIEEDKSAQSRPGCAASLATSGSEPSAAVWRPIASAPFDGTPIWGFLYETGIRLLRWVSPEECAEYEGSYDVEEYDGCWVEVADFDEEWSPEFWMPLDALPLPEGAAIKGLAALARADSRQ